MLLKLVKLYIQVGGDISYQNTKLAYTYTREYVFDTSGVPLAQPTISSEDFNAGGTGATGQADYRLGMMQSVLENLFPGIIRPFRNSTGPVTPDIFYIPSAQFDTDWNLGERGMIYTSNLTLTGASNFGLLGLPFNTIMLKLFIRFLFPLFYYLGQSLKLSVLLKSMQ